MKRGEVYWVDFDPAVGGEIQKVRPAVVVSNDGANAALNRVLVVPLTSKVKIVYPGQVLVQIRGAVSKAMADQLTVASKLRVKNLIGVLTPSEMELLERAMLFQLGIKRGNLP